MPSLVSGFEYDILSAIVIKTISTMAGWVNLLPTCVENWNRLIEMQRTSHPDQAGEYVIFRDEFTPGSIPVYSHWNNLVLLLSASQAEGSIWEMFSLAIQRTTWDDDGEIVGSKRTETYDHEFNADGYLKTKSINRIPDQPWSPDDS